MTKCQCKCTTETLRWPGLPLALKCSAIPGDSMQSSVSVHIDLIEGFGSKMDCISSEMFSYGSPEILETERVMIYK